MMMLSRRRSQVVASTRIQQLNKLAGQVPGVTKQAANVAQSQQDLSLLDTTRQVGLRPGAAGQIAAARTQSEGQIQAQAAGQQQQALAQVGGQMVQQQGMNQQDRLAKLSRSLQEKSRTLTTRLSQLDENAKNRILDNELQFKRDEMGRTLFNDRQLADFALLQANNAEDIRNYQQTVEQLSRRKLQMLQAAQTILTQQLELDYQRESKQLSQDQILKLQRAKKELEAKIAKEQADRANRAGMNSALGGIVGGVGGAFIGGPTGAMIGQQLGSGLGANL
jgi:hypothetical protein